MQEFMQEQAQGLSFNRLCDLKILEKKEIEGHHYYLNLELYRILSE